VRQDFEAAGRLRRGLCFIQRFSLFGIGVLSFQETGGSRGVWSMVTGGVADNG
jgi:hypothetical protein